MTLRFWRRRPPGFTHIPQFSAEDVVRAGYRAILAREPDEEGLGVHAAMLARDPAALADVLRAIVRAPESAVVNRSLLLTGLGAVETPLVSLGTHCFTSEFLKRQQLRPWAGPFDWIFSKIPMVEHCIRDDFATFLDRSLYRPVPHEERRHGADFNRVDHAFYLAKFNVQHVFNHHDVHEDADYAYITRTVERFRGALRSPQPHLFVLFNFATPRALEQLQGVADAIREAGGGRHRVLAFLVDDAGPGRLVPEVRIEQDDPALIAMRFGSVSKWLPLEFADPLDELVLSKLLRDIARGLPSSPEHER